MIARIFPALLLSLISSTFFVANAADTTGAHQAAVWVDPGWRRTVSRYNVTFDEQGLSTGVFEFEIEALDEKGAEAISRQTIAYNSYFSALSSDDLATVKADGSVIAVDKRAIRDQPASTDTSSPYFDEQRQRIIVYSNVAPGDKIRGRLTYKAKRPEFAGEFAHYWVQPADQPPEVIEITLDGPASKPLHIAGNVEHSEERSGKRIIHHVRMRQETPRPRLADSRCRAMGTARDEKLAARWYQKAADQGDVYSQACLATLYRDGRGLAQDFQQAASWYAKAADQGYAWAQMNLGLLYAEGKGVPLDYAKAISFFRKAAERNDSYAQYNLGWVYESGKGVPKDTQQAIEWYSKAAEGGNALARAHLAGLTSGASFWETLFRHIGSFGGL